MPTVRRTAGVTTSGTGRVPAWASGLLSGSGPASLLLFVIAFGWKLYCLRRLLGSPLAPVLSADAQVYWEWSRLIAEQGWLGQNPFFLGPLYPYALSVFRAAGVTDTTAPLLFQCVLGSLTVVLVFQAARRLVPTRYALVSGALAAGYAMATFMDLSILSECVLAFLEALFLWSQLRLRAGRVGSGDSVAAGALIGLMSLARPSAVLLGWVHVVAVHARTGKAAALRAGAIAGAVTLLMCSPVLIRHQMLGHGPILTTYSLGYNLYVGNGPRATGGFDSNVEEYALSASSNVGVEGGTGSDGREFLAGRAAGPLSARASSAEFVRLAMEAIRHEPGRWLRLLAFKAGLSLNHTEASQVGSLAVYSRTVGATGLPFVGEFGLLGTLGLFGLVLIARRPQGAVVLAQAAALWLPMLIFFVTDRYRYHLAIPLLVAIAPAVEWLIAPALREHRSIARWLSGMSGLAACAAIVWLPLVPLAGVQTEFEVRRQVAEASIRRGDLERGIPELERCVAPEILARLPLQRSVGARRAVAGVFETVGKLRLSSGDYAAGERALHAALGYNPGNRGLALDHALALALSGQVPEAERRAQGVGYSRAALLQELLGIGARAASADATGRAEVAVRAAITLDSTSEVANVVLLRILRSQGRDAEAREHAARFRARGVPAAVVARETAGL